jgi:hypothetical protein
MHPETPNLRAVRDYLLLVVICLAVCCLLRSSVARVPWLVLLGWFLARLCSAFMGR